MAQAEAAAGYRLFRYRSFDGLTLAARDYEPGAAGLPLVCLPGLTRTARDFHDLALRLAGPPAAPRRVVAFDYRGRGASDRDPDPDNYTPATELRDVLDGIDLLAIERAVFVGTSRGGIVTALAAGARPGLVAAAILNDIGPVLEPAGLAGIAAYVGATPDPADWGDAEAALRRIFGDTFPGLDDAEWSAFARMSFAERTGRPAVDYDPALRHGLAAMVAQGAPPLWELFAALADVPVLLLRGAHSPLLSAETLAAMVAAHPRMETAIVAGQGHPPLLRGPLADRVAAFVDRVAAAG